MEKLLERAFGTERGFTEGLGDSCFRLARAVLKFVKLYAATPDNRRIYLRSHDILPEWHPGSNICMHASRRNSRRG